ncbi:rRNA maturation RNase YbeY [Buchnera aphidicola]|uniref:Endoribonuclease YbeY n=1 Tax=Buchnera aphidicola subsp. Tuberolachnus salignus TaxID=98804 RepID=A0A170PC70_BUCTT|nr:rRNA maturation RNase YbeY [Buchnera aphidicola]CUR53259.1 Endoribonuclease YbeY [Buchnera aphidicola (Tuberolachnus salignus)]
MKTIIKINIQKICKKKNNIPSLQDFQYWLHTILKGKKIELTIRIVEKYEIKNLNFLYRKKNKVTNVLSFFYNTQIKKKSLYYLGDIVFCKKYIEYEIFKYKKNYKEHWAHLTIHSTLHLLNYNHDTLKDQKKMEKLETKLMLNLGYKNPY